MMRDAQDQTAGADGAWAEATDEIARSLGTVWQRYSGVRPKSTTVEIGSDVVRCVIEEGALDGGPGDDPAQSSLAPSPSALQQDSSATVSRATGRRVAAYIPKRDTKAGTTKQTFILDRSRKKY